jgi:hypothetical protein
METIFWILMAFIAGLFIFAAIVSPMAEDWPPPPQGPKRK